jgi:hypothetical protein
MAFTDFTLENVESKLGLTIVPGDLFPGLAPVPAPPWLPPVLAEFRAVFARSTEKARSESIVAPILIAAAATAPPPVTIFSGHKFDVDATRSLVGECDFLLARTEPIPRVKAPVLSVIEAKRADIDLGIGQCIAQMVATQEFNKRANSTVETSYGCVTNGIEWQFLRLDGTVVAMDRELFVTVDLPRLLGALRVSLSVGV